MTAAKSPMRAFSAAALVVAAAAAVAQTIELPGYFVEPVAVGISVQTTMALIGDNDFLIIEKNTGKVKRFLNGVFQGEALDLAINSEGERGLLGITVHPDFAANRMVYIYYSRAESDGGAWLENRVDRFIWNGSSLVFDRVIITFPFSTANRNEPYHHAGIIRVGPDRKLYIVTGDMGRGYFGTPPTIEVNRSETDVAGVGGVHRLNLDGSIPSDNPFISHPDSRIQTMFAYAIRNSFGMAFDRISNRLWLTDNGPEVYDEVCIVDSGFNSGWLKIMGPDGRDATYNQNLHQSYNASDLVYLPGAFYRDPEFSWLTPIGVTSIEFLRGNKFGPGERNNAVVAEVNNGQLYMFQVNAARDGFVLTGDVSDRVADTPAERDANRIGTGWNAVTDLQIGPDGYLYVVILDRSKVMRIRPTLEAIAPQSLTVFRGVVVSGDLASVLDSDDVRLQVRPGATLNNQEAPVQLILEGTAPIARTTELRYLQESSASIGNIGQKIELYNFKIDSYEQVDFRIATTTDSVVEITVTANPSRFIQAGTRRMRTRSSWKEAGPVFSYPWSAQIDQVVWKVRVQ